MPTISSGKRILIDGVILWDGINRPDAISATTEKPACYKYSLKIAISPTNPDLVALYALADTATKAKWPLGAPANANAAITEPGISELPGWVAINCVTYNAIPDVLNTAHPPLAMQPIEYQRLLYPGCKVRVITSPRVYDDKQKGTGWWLEGVQLIDSSAPRLSIASGLSTQELSNIFASVSSESHTAEVVPTSVVANPGILTGGVPTPPPLPISKALSKEPEHIMLPAANGATYEACLAIGWTDELLIEHGLMKA